MSRQMTAKKAAELLVDKDQGFIVPTGSQKQSLLVAFAKKGVPLYGRAFDIVWLKQSINLDDSNEIEKNIKEITFYEIKSTGKSSVKENFEGYFFGLTTAELLVAQSLGEQYRFAFVNTLTGEVMDLSLRDLFAKAKGIYPTWSIRF